MVPIYKKALKLCELVRLLAVDQSLQKIKALRCSNIHFSTFGRSKIKFEFHLSVDSFIQTALHVTWFRLTGQLAFCAEYVPCRFYANGRSETLRSLTAEMVDFVK